MGLDSTWSGPGWNERRARRHHTLLPNAGHFWLAYANSEESGHYTDILGRRLVIFPFLIEILILLRHLNSCCIAAIVRLILIDQSVRQVERSLNSIRKLYSVQILPCAPC